MVLTFPIPNHKSARPTLQLRGQTSPSNRLTSNILTAIGESRNGTFWKNNRLFSAAKKVLVISLPPYGGSYEDTAVLCSFFYSCAVLQTAARMNVMSKTMGMIQSLAQYAH
jgi:hypothetical protein